ncbi:AbrB/MazE/SpoVT family DNA-binding domain-containing protein [Thiocapsa roseopersicina]|uniref:Transcriptional regulator, AbrB family n=1 Tax=Thiocapsa roseopersicina TaxID=1058 RepID=A0A1H2PZ41_THIRO|nr:AbrB/MazE/SpoVT family DNA-binding domain-containing protein [Thiocapsa roseopersicina]SDW00146.1 transcriptional regulator, AbrB family [Thiocapsa roseopersicina]
METTRLSNNGQVKLPKSIREQYHWPAGTELEIEECPDSIVLRPKKPVPTTLLSDVVGCAGYRGPANSLDDMDEAIAWGVSESHARSRYTGLI